MRLVGRQSVTSRWVPVDRPLVVNSLDEVALLVDARYTSKLQVHLVCCPSLRCTHSMIGLSQFFVDRSLFPSATGPPSQQAAVSVVYRQRWWDLKTWMCSDSALDSFSYLLHFWPRKKSKARAARVRNVQGLHMSLIQDGFPCCTKLSAAVENTRSVLLNHHGHQSLFLCQQNKTYTYCRVTRIIWQISKNHLLLMSKNSLAELLKLFSISQSLTS